MTAVYYDENPTTSDIVLFDLVTKDLNGTAIDPYKVNTIIIYFIERGFSIDNIYQYTKTIGSNIYTEYFKEAVPIAIFGNSEYPAWIASDPSHEFITKIDEDDDGNPLVGTFRLQWTPQLSFAREGDYLLCMQWTPVIAGDTISENTAFYLYSDTSQTTSIPSHYTPPDKYVTLLERYQPEVFSTRLGVSDLTHDILNRLNQAIAKGFTTIEDQTNQIVDLIDANVISDALLPYLGNLFALNLKSQDTTLWRKQIKRAIPLAKKKGTLSGLQEALENADIRFIGISQLWQVVSESTWQEGFLISEDEETEFELEKVALLPVETDNFEVYIRYAGNSYYDQLTIDYISFNDDGTIVTWVGDNLSISPISLSAGDVLRIIYKIAEPADQSIEDYIRTLPLADQRDEVQITLPRRNWNVRLISETDPMFDVIVPERHPFKYPVVFGKVRTEFPYSENVYNMDSYNGSSRDSTSPCDLDKTFMDVCSSCLSSKFDISVEIEDLSSERIEETFDIIKDFVPFHAVINTVSFSGSKSEFIPSPIEEIEILIRIIQNDNIVATQMDFNRLIYDGSSYAATLKRGMLASTSTTSHTGTGVNLAITLFSPGIQFGGLGFSNSNNTYLEILSGTDTGEYQVENFQRFTIDIVQGNPDTISWPLDTSGFPFRLSNVLFSGNVDITQNDDYIFSDQTVSFIDYGTADDWKVVITSGVYVGVYSISSVNPNNTISILGFPTTTANDLEYELRNASNQGRFSGTAGSVSTISTGIVDFDIDAYRMGIRSGDYVKYDSVQYKILGIDGNTAKISNYSEGTIIGTASVDVYHRVIDNAVGYLEIRGMQLTGDVPTVDYTAETNQFLDNYAILIGTNYYQVDSIDGSDMILNGPMLSWGLSAVAVDYSIVQFIKTSPITTEEPPEGVTYAGAVEYNLLDRRGNESVVITTETAMPMFMRVSMLNGINNSQPVETVAQQEEIWFDIEYKD